MKNSEKEEKKMLKDMNRLSLKDLDIPAYKQGKRDASRGIYGFNPYNPFSLRGRSYGAGNY